VTGPPASVTEAGPLRQAGRGIGRAAALIGGITVIARMVGFGRQLVFAHTVGSHCLGTAYATANQVPNIIYDIVLGGALTSAIVPVLAGAAALRAQYRPVPGARPGNPGAESVPAGGVPADAGHTAGGHAGGGRVANGHMGGAPSAGGSPGASPARPGQPPPAPSRPETSGPGTSRAAAAGAGTAATGTTAADVTAAGTTRAGVAGAGTTPALTAEAGKAEAGTAGQRAVTATARLGADAEAAQIASALLTWTVVLLAPASLIVALVAHPLTSLLLGGVPHCAQSAVVSLSSRMLVVFAPQILLYGLAVVLYGILQAHRRFTAPALAPVVSSVVVIGAYLAFVPLAAGHRGGLAGLPLSAELMLSVGTTAGVAALMVTALGPALRLRLRLRPTLRFPPSVARRVRALAAVGVAAFVAQDTALVVVIVLANGHQGAGAVVLYNYGWQMFFVPYAVLAVPIATSVFPLLSAATGGEFDRTAAGAVRAAMLVSWLGAALLAGAAWPAARLFVTHPQQVHQLALTFLAFAPGLVGFGLSAALSRVLFASGRSRVAATALVGGWLVVIAVDVAAVPLVDARWVVPVLGLGNTIGLTYTGIALVLAVRNARGTAALRGSARAAGAGLAGAVAGGAAGALVSASLPVSGFIPNAMVTVLACLGAAAVFGVAALMLDGGDLRALAARSAGRWAR
jgi:putative peptidoglycan lipid II flippase